MSEQIDQIVFWTFVVNLTITFLLMLRKRLLSKEKTPQELKTYLVGIFTTNISIMFGIHMQMPYRYQLYMDNGLTHSMISKIMCYHQLTAGIWSVFLPFAMKKMGHRWLMIIGVLTLAVSSLIMGVGEGSLESFMIATCIAGLTMPTIIRCINDIWQLDEKTLPPEWNANYVYNEWRSLTSLLLTWIVSPLSSYIASQYGVSSIFSLTPGFALAAIIPICFFVPSKKERMQRQMMQKEAEEKQQNANQKIPSKPGEGKRAHFKTPKDDLPAAIVSTDDLSVWSELMLVKRQFAERKITYFIVLLDITYQIAFFLFMQRKAAFLLTPEHKPPMGFVSGSYGVLDLTGAQLVSMFASLFPYKVWLGLSTFLTSLSSFAVYFFYSNKIVVFAVLCLNSFTHSAIMTNIFFLHKEYFPSHLRNYFVSLTRIPTSIISCLIMWFWKTEKIEQYALLSGLAMIVCSLMFFILICVTPKKMDQSDEKKLLDTEDTSSSTSQFGELQEEEESPEDMA